LTVFYNYIVEASLAISKGLIEKSEGHYIDEIRMYKKVALQLKSMNQFCLQADGENYVRPMVDFCNEMAETYERKASRLEEKRKHIEFLSPTDRKVFIVHGHERGILLELKAMLKELKIDPIILADEDDDGENSH